MLTDTHCHLCAPELHGRLAETLAEAEAAGVGGCIVPAAAPQDWDAVSALARQRFVRAAAIGLHPWQAEAASDALWQDLDARLAACPALWVGETGLDFLRARDGAGRRLQTAALHSQLRLAQAHRRPVILHNVRAGGALLDALEHSGFDLGGIVHAFSGSLEEAHRFIRKGFFIGIGSLLLNPDARKARRAAALLPGSAILLETDSPYMLPGRTNTPAVLARVAAEAARLRGIPLEELADLCEKNLRILLSKTLRKVNL